LKKNTSTSNAIAMNKLKYVFIVCLACFASCGNRYKTLTKTDKNGFSYQTVTNDPYNLRIYTLDNGLKVYLAVNANEPRIQTYIPIKAGSSYDPTDNTGLAHYLEHLMFKGSSRLGTINWEAEKPIIDSIEKLYEQHKLEPTAAGKKSIYKIIDNLSNIAAQYAVPNEYDKLMASIGATNVNAYTSYEETVYECDIPSNELERWLQIESERLFDMQMRLFHTELETVYEEFNKKQDDDSYMAYLALLAKLYPTHPYGQQTIIGKAEHLKNPSMTNIKSYYHNYYVPNNMAICLSGDLNFDETICLINKYFGEKRGTKVIAPKMPIEQPFTANTDTTIVGPQTEMLIIGYRFDGAGSTDEKFINIISYILQNDRAGLIDIDLLQKQKILTAEVDLNAQKDYSELMIFATPKQGQTLEDVRDILLAEIEKLKNGDFEDWLVEACINNLNLNEIENRTNRISTSQTFVTNFIKNIRWENYLQDINSVSQIKKADIVEFAKRKFNYCATVYKKIGIDTNAVKVEKPQITPLPPQCDTLSAFAQKILHTESTENEPYYIDFTSAVSTQKIYDSIELNYIKNTQTPLFELNYIFEFGYDNSKLISLANNYLPLIGTNQYTAEQLQKEFFRLGLKFDVTTNAQRCIIKISGLEENAEKGIELLEHVLNNAQADTAMYADYVAQIISNRYASKKEPDNILKNAMLNYVKYGEKSSFTNILSADELKNISPDTLTNIVHNIENYPHSIFYYGQKSENEVVQMLKKHHPKPTKYKTIKAATYYAEKELRDEVYFVDFDMVQTMIMVVSKGEKFTPGQIPMNTFFNEYYSGNMSSIIFQDIRELKGLAYTAKTHISTPLHKNESFYNIAFVGTQFDKMQTATDEMLYLLNNAQWSEMLFKSSKSAIKKQIATSRIIGVDIYKTVLKNNDLGINFDTRQSIFEKVQTLTQDEFINYFNQNISNKPKTILILGNKNLIDFNTLKKYGKVHQLTLEQVFGY